MSESINFIRGQILRKGDVAFRVIYVTPDNIVLVRLGTTKLDIHMETTAGVYLAVVKGSAILETPQVKVFDARLVPEKYLAAYDIKKQIISRVTDEYGPTFLSLSHKNKKALLDSLADEFRYTRKTINNIIRNYLQNGMTEASLLDARWFQTGTKRTTEFELANQDDGQAKLSDKKAEWFRYFNEALMYKIACGKDVTYRSAYNGMIASHFSDLKLDESGNVQVYEKEKNEIPSYDQFVRYCHKAMTKEEEDKVTLGAMEQRNNKRILLGSANTGVDGCYDCCEMDAWESDFSLVSENDPDKVVGRAIIYMIKDVETRMIVAASVGFDNNSVKGCLNCLANLNEPKKELFAKYDIPFNDDRIWPTGYQPRMLRVDNGSEFISSKLFEVMPRLGISQVIVPPGMGSMKAVIERSFEDIHQELRSFLANYGHISKDHGSKHHEKALLNIRQFTKLVLIYINAYNRELNNGIGYTKDMAEKKIPQIPYLAMQYYMHKSPPRLLPQGEEFFKAFLFDCSATITKAGLVLNTYNLNYINRTDQQLLERMYRLDKKREKFPALYDPRNVDFIYYISDGHLKRAELNTDIGKQRDYLGMTFDQFEKLQKIKKEANTNAYKDSRSAQLTSMVNYAQTVNEAKKGNTTYNNPKNIRENRFEEQQKVSREFSLENRFGNSLVPELSEPEPDDRPHFTEQIRIEPVEQSATETTDRLMEAMFNDDYE